MTTRRRFAWDAPTGHSKTHCVGTCWMGKRNSHVKRSGHVHWPTCQQQTDCSYKAAWHVRLPTHKRGVPWHVGRQPMQSGFAMAGWTTAHGKNVFCPCWANSSTRPGWMVHVGWMANNSLMQSGSPHVVVISSCKSGLRWCRVTNSTWKVVCCVLVKWHVELSNLHKMVSHAGRAATQCKVVFYNMLVVWPTHAMAQWHVDMMSCMRSSCKVVHNNMSRWAQCWAASLCKEIHRVEMNNTNTDTQKSVCVCVIWGWVQLIIVKWCSSRSDRHRSCKVVSRCVGYTTQWCEEKCLDRLDSHTKWIAVTSWPSWSGPKVTCVVGLAGQEKQSGSACRRTILPVECGPLCTSDRTLVVRH